MAYGNKPSGKAKPSVYPYGPSGTGSEAVSSKDKSNKKVVKRGKK